MAIASCRERWSEFLALEHETLSPIRRVESSDGELRLFRETVGGQPLARCRVPRPFRAPLLLQAVSAAAFFASRGVYLSPADFDDARWDVVGGTAFLWLTRSPHGLRDGSETPVSEAVGAALARIYSPGGGRMTPGAARELADQLGRPEAAAKRGEYWVASSLRGFAELASPLAGPARERCLGLPGDALRSAASRARAEAVRAVLRGRRPKLFESGSSRLTPGGALGLSPLPDGVGDAARRLRELASVREGGPPCWIAVAPETWDPVSRRAFDSARRALDGAVEVVVVPEQRTLPDSPAEWRRAIWVPCGSLAASVRFYEWLAAQAKDAKDAMDAHQVRRLVRSFLGGDAWVSYVADPTGHAPLPLPAAATVPVSSRPEPPARRGVPSDPGRRVEELLEAGRTGLAFVEAERWVARFPARPAEAWFPLAARLSATGAALPPWLEEIEAEREIAGGRPEEAKARLERVGRNADADAARRRRVRLRAAEVAVVLGQPAEAARRAAEWRRHHPDAPPVEAVRALRIGAVAFSREGRADCALALLDDADRLGVGLSPAESVETSLARARVLALSGRFEEEQAIYDSVRSRALSAGEDRLAARFLAQEARGLLDRRDFPRAIVRLEEALDVARADPAECAELRLDLSAALYHAGRVTASEEALREALAAASVSGRSDLVRIARGNRVELLLRRGDLEEAAAEIASLETSARAENDTTHLLVALHHRGRLALRRGRIAEAARDNAEAQRLARETGDRLEIGELRLEEGDRLLFEGDVVGACRAWEAAAAAPADRSERDEAARRRLLEASWRASGGPPGDAVRRIEAGFDEDPFEAAQAVARWYCLCGAAGVPPELQDRAVRVLRERGAAELASRVFGAGPSAPFPSALRRVRDAVLAVLDGRAASLDGALSRLGIAGLAIRDAEGTELVRLGPEPVPPGIAGSPLEAGAGRFTLALWPAPAPETESALTLLLETLLHRRAAAPSSSEGGRADWSRLGIVTADASMDAPYERLTRFAAQSVTVLVLGESGCGKEAVARAIHRLSGRASGPFVAVNVAAIPSGVVESELFGHARGAFTGADRERRGLLEEAAGGTIFFDEIGDLALPLQAKLLRALQEREMRRVGENRNRAVDVRVVSATARDLERDVESGRFREDLYYRLHVAVIRLPPLRERGRDAVLLARHFLERHAREFGRGRLSLAPEAVAAIAAYAWPGNVRELQNSMAQAAALCDAEAVVTPEFLPETIRPPKTAAVRGDYRARVDAHRRDLIADALDRAGGNRSRAARDLGLSRQALLYLIRELRVPVGRS